MTAADLPPPLLDRPFDHDRGWPVPFVHEHDDGTYDLDRLNGKRVTQCALSRVCAMCAQTLDFPLAFLGDQQSADERAYTYPPMHESCAEAAVRLYPPTAASAAGRPTDAWVMLLTGSFQVERPSRRGDPTRFRPAEGEVRTFGP